MGKSDIDYYLNDHESFNQVVFDRGRKTYQPETHFKNSYQNENVGVRFETTSRGQN